MTGGGSGTGGGYEFAGKKFARVVIEGVASTHRETRQRGEQREPTQVRVMCTMVEGA